MSMETKVKVSELTIELNSTKLALQSVQKTLLEEDYQLYEDR